MTRLGSWPARAGLVAGVSLLLAGSLWGLLLAPGDRYMGEVQRIMYVHVPTAWAALVALGAAFSGAVGYLWTRRPSWDALHEAAVEVGVVLSALLCVQGAIWAKPTWGVWWDWDPRLTTVAVMVFAFAGVLALRHAISDPRQRGVWSAAASILAFADVPIVYFSVRWWSSLHQVQSTPGTIDAGMLGPLRLNAIGMLLLAASFVAIRARLSIAHRATAPSAGAVGAGGGAP